MKSVLENVKNEVTEEEVKKLVFVYKNLDRKRRNLLSVGSAMLLASQNAEEDEMEETEDKKLELV